MLRASAGTWVNYATTALFQVLFAKEFGSTSTASAYALTFTISVAIGAVFIGTAQSVYIPRLLSADGAVMATGLRRMLLLTLLALVAFAAMAFGAPAIASVIGQKLIASGVHLAALIRFAAVFGFSQVCVGQLAALCWARGFRFVPAVTPALPSIVASVPMIVDGHVSTHTLYALLTLGSGLQIVWLAAVGFRSIRFSSASLGQLGRVTGGFLGAFAIAQFIVPFEVFVASHATPSGGANFNYAYRALAVAQLLIVGGLSLGALPEWSDHVRVQARLAFERSVAQTLSVAVLALSLAAAVAAVASRMLVRVVFQHGSFTAHDTRVVSTIMFAALVGFATEGVMLVASQALLADRRNRAAVAFGIARTAAALLLVALFGYTYGPVGVAVGYSATNALMLVAQLVYLYRQRILTERQLRLGQATLLVTGPTLAAAALARLAALSAITGAGLVVAVFLVLLVVARDRLPRSSRMRLPFSAARPVA